MMAAGRDSVCSSLSLVLYVLATILLVCSKATAAGPYDGCREAVVGGGWSGVYWLYRRATHSPTTAAGLCLFEASDRLGGRTYSLPIVGTELTIDIGAYRFTPDMHLPGDVILKVLELPTECYEPHCPPADEEFPQPFHFNYSAPLRRIVDPVTRLPAGYATAIHQLAAEAQKLGAKVFTGTKVTDIEVLPGRNGAKLSVLAADGHETAVESSVTLLNLPRNQLLAMPSVAPSLTQQLLATLKCIKFDKPPNLYPFNETSLEGNTALSKVYLYYEDAWWHTKLDRTSGQTPENGWLPQVTEAGVSILIHWNDGPVSCIDSGADRRCQGFLEVYYTVSNETFFSGLPGQPGSPLKMVRRSDQGPNSSRLLDTAHAGVLEVVDGLLRDRNIDPSELVPPSMMVAGVWNRPNDQYPLGDGFTAPTKVYYSPAVSGSLAEACSVPGLTEAGYASSLLQPWGGSVPVYLANNDYQALDIRLMYGDWAEDSLVQAERGLRRLGLPRPHWLDAKYYEEKISGADDTAPSAVVRASPLSLRSETAHVLPRDSQ